MVRLKEACGRTVSPPDSRFDVTLSVAVIEGRVTDPQGLPLPGVRVDVNERGGRRRNTSRRQPNMTVSEDERGNLQPDWGAGSRRITTDKQGHYSLRGLATGVQLGVSVSGQYVVSDTVSGIELAEGEIRRLVNFELREAGVLEVRIKGAKGNYRVTAKREGAKRSSWIWNSRPARITGMDPGPWTVTVVNQNGGSEGKESAREVEVLPGETVRVNFDAP